MLVKNLKNFHQICSLLIQIVIYSAVLLFSLLSEVNLQALLIDITCLLSAIIMFIIILRSSFLEEYKKLKLKMIAKVLTSAIIMSLPVLKDRRTSS